MITGCVAFQGVGTISLKEKVYPEAWAQNAIKAAPVGIFSSESQVFPHIK